MVMTTYELIRHLIQMDPDGNSIVMLSVNHIGEKAETEFNGFINDLSVEYLSNGSRAIIVNASDC